MYMEIKDFDSIELNFKEFGVAILGTAIEKFKITEKGQLNDIVYCY